MTSHPWHFLLESPLGPLGARADAQGRITRLAFLDRRRLTLDCLAELQAQPAFRFLQRQVDAYFQGTCRTFNVPVAPEGTPFQRQVWDALLEIPYGRTLTLSALATRLGSPDLEDPADQVIRQNPLALLIPSHRIVGLKEEPLPAGHRQQLLALEQGERLLSPLLAQV